MTFAEFKLLPEIEGKRELIDGEVIDTSAWTLDHSTATKRLLFLLFEHLDLSRVSTGQTGSRIGQSWIQPDVSVSWPGHERDQQYLLGSPMIAEEVLSPGEEIEPRLTIYFEGGARGLGNRSPAKSHDPLLSQA